MSKTYDKTLNFKRTNNIFIKLETARRGVGCGEGAIAKSIYAVLATAYLKIQLGEKCKQFLGFTQALMSRRFGIVYRLLDDYPIVLDGVILDLLQIFDILNNIHGRYQKFTMEMEYNDYFIPIPDIRMNKIPKTHQV